MPAILPWIERQILDAAGVPVVGAKIYPFSANTNTPKATYQDALGLTPNTHPIVTDAAGRFKCFLDSGSYDFQVTDSADVALYTLEDISGGGAGGDVTLGVVSTIAELKALSGGAFDSILVMGYWASGDGGGGLFRWNSTLATTEDRGAVFIPNSAPAAGRWVRAYSGKVDARWFGCQGDGANNDITFILAAAAYVQSLTNGGTLFFPACSGGYLYSTDPAFGSKVTVEMDAGAYFKATGGSVAMTFNGRFLCGRTKAFDTSVGTVSFSTGVVWMVFPEWWGAVPVATAGTTDSTTAVQKAAVAARSAQAELNFGAGTYQISLSIDITGDGAPIRWKGLGKYYTFIRAVAGSTIPTALLNLTDTDDNALAATYTDYASRSKIEGISFAGGGVIGSYPGHGVTTAARAQWGIKGCSNHFTLKDCRFMGFGTAAIDMGYSHSSELEDVEVSATFGDCVRFNRLGSNNALTFINLQVYQSTGFGLRVRDCATLNWSGGLIETNDKGGIYFESNVKGFSVKGVYFESNGQTGWTFTADAAGVIVLAAIKAHVILNGDPTNTTISNASECSGEICPARISMGPANYFVFAPAQNGLKVAGAMLTGADTGYLVGTYGGATPTSFTARCSFNCIRIENCTGWNKASSGYFKATSFPLDIVAADANETFFDPASNINLAETDLSKWSLISAGSGGTWAKSASEIFPYDTAAEVYELNLASVNQSDAYGFAIDATKLTSLSGKVMAFSIWMKHTDIADLTGVARLNPLGTSRQIAMDYYTGTPIGWVRLTAIFQLDTSINPLTFDVRKIVKNAGAAGSIFVANPVLCEFGSQLQALQGIRKMSVLNPAFTGQLGATQATLGSSVQSLKSTATNDDPEEKVVQNRVATTDATVTTMHTFAVPANTTLAIEATVLVRRTGGAAGVAQDGARYKLLGVFKNVGGVATLIGALTKTADEDQAGWDASLDVSGGNVLARVTGSVNNNVVWHMTARVYQVST